MYLTKFHVKRDQSTCKTTFNDRYLFTIEGFNKYIDKQVSYMFQTGE